MIAKIMVIILVVLFIYFIGFWSGLEIGYKIGKNEHKEGER